MISQTIPPDVAIKYREIQITLFKKLTDKQGNTTALGDWLDDIQNGRQCQLIEQIRATRPGVERDALKKQLDGVTISAVFEGQRKANLIKQHSGLLGLDFDKVEDLDRKLNAIKCDPYCLAVFISPSGNGIKVVVPINPEKHKEAFRTLSEYFLIQYGLIADEACKDVPRLMYTSYDPNLHFNGAAARWPDGGDLTLLIQAIALRLKLTYPFPEGTRNQSCFKLAAACKREKINQSEVVAVFEKLYLSENFTSEEIRKTVENGYSTTHDPLYNVKTGFTKIHAVESYLSERYEFRFNEVSLTVESRTVGSDDAFIQVNENNLWMEIIKAQHEVGQNKLLALLRSDFVEKYDPFKRYFDSLGDWNPASEPDFILELMKYISVKDQDRFVRHFKKMLVRTIACALEPRVFNKQCLVLVQKKQNSGKSTFCRWLCPPALSDYIAENINTDKDSLIALSTNFIINLDELATLGRAEINSLKSFMSKDKINARAPYERRAAVYPRRASFIGSTNQMEFLVDDTGSVRWLCFEVTEINFDYRQKICVDNIWRQAYQLYRDGLEYQLTQDEIAENERSNKTFQVQTQEMEWIIKVFAPLSKEEGGQFMAATDMAFHIARLFDIKLSPQKIGKALSQLGFEQETGKKEGKAFTLKGYYVKVLM